MGLLKLAPNNPDKRDRAMVWIYTHRKDDGTWIAQSIEEIQIHVPGRTQAEAIGNVILKSVKYKHMVMELRKPASLSPDIDYAGIERRKLAERRKLPDRRISHLVKPGENDKG